MQHYQQYVDILNEELMPAMGCTEPIAIAYCASLLKDTLNGFPTQIKVIVSGNILKNVKSVTVPHTNGLNGIKAAVGIGIIAGDSSKKLEVISSASKKQIEKLPDYLKNTPISIASADNNHTLYIEIIGSINNDTAKVIIQDAHTNVYLIEKNNEVIYKNETEVVKNVSSIDKSILNIKEIIEFADKVDIKDVKKTLDRQIKYNMAIANEGLKK